MAKTRELLVSHGAELVEIKLPHERYAVATYYIIATGEASSNLSRFDGVHYGHRSADVDDLSDVYTHSRSEGFGPEVKRRILLVRTFCPPAITTPTTKKPCKCAP